MLSKKMLIFSVVLVLISLFFSYSSNINYSCANYWSYLRITSAPDCYYNPDATSNTSEIIRRHLNLVETHQVETEDGYILTLFRAPHPSPKGTILLQHCVLYDSTVWIAQHNDSIAFFFWRRGYDVWLGNFRGNFYSKKHKTLTRNDPKFWNYTITELGYLDNKATIDYIVQKNNGSKIIYLGFSMGASAGLVYASTRPEEAAKNLKAVVAMAPPAIPKHAESWFYPSGKVLGFLYSLSGYTKIYSLGGFDVWYVKLFHAFHGLARLKKYALYAFAPMSGWYTEEFDPRFINDLVTHFGSELSFKTFHHFGQLTQSGGSFKMYNYGQKENLAAYGTEEPPKFPISKIKVPILLVSSANDTIAPVVDLRLLEMELPDHAKRYGTIELDGFNHMDLLFGKRRNLEIYDKILEKLEFS